MDRSRSRIVFACTALALAASASVATPREACAQSSNESVAQLRFQRGRELFGQQRYADALVEFQATLALVGSPNTRLYISRCLHQLGRNAEALAQYRQAAAEASDRAATDPRYAATRDAAREEAAQIEPLVGRLTLHVPNAPAGLTLSADGNPLPAQMVDIPAPFDPHPVRVVVHAPGYRDFEQTVTIEAGHESEVTVRLERAPEQPVVSTSSAPPATRVVTVRTGGVVRYAGFAVAGVGLVGGAVLTGVFGSMALTRHNELQQTCNAPCPELESRIAEGETYRTIANVSIGVGAALLVAGGVMILVGGPREVQRTESLGPAHAWRVMPWGAPNPFGATAGIDVRF